MQFDKIINARINNEPDKPLMKKDLFPVNERLQKYLHQYGRDVALPVSYKDLLNYRHSTALRNKKGKLTHWETAVYDLKEMEFLKEGLIKTYATLKTEGNLSFIKHLDVERIDFCEFGNSMPFRIRIINRINDNYDHYYVKAADASRIYGLELEHLLSPNRITFLYHRNTLVEEHIPGIPGDVFLEDYLEEPETNKIRIAKEFVKFNERCFIRLLGDMRSYNYVFDITPDFEEVVDGAEVVIPHAVGVAIMESDIGPSIAYYLAKNQDEAERISRLSPTAAIRAIGKIEAKLESAEQKPAASSAPKPVDPVSGKGRAVQDPDKMSADEWLEWRTAQIRKKRNA